MSEVPETGAVRPLRVAFCHYAADFYGGSDRGLYDTVVNLPRDRFAPVMLLRHEDPMADWYRDQGVPVETFSLVPPRKALDPLKQARFFAQFWPSVFRLKHAIQRMDADVVHVNTLFNLQGPWAARLAGRPLVWHVRELMPGSRIYAMLAKRVNKMATRAVAMSNAIAGALPVPPERLRVVLGSVDPALYADLPARRETRAALGLDAETPVVFCPGRFEHWKGQHILVEALPRVFAEHPNAVAWFAGSPAINKPEYHAGVVNRCKELGIAEKVHFLGRRDDVPALMAAADVLALPSVTPEPFGLTVVEAMAAGCPVVATRAGGPFDSVAEGETGLLVTPEDPAALAAGINALLGDPARARAMGEAGVRRVHDHFTIAREVREMAAILEEAAGAHCRHEEH